MSNPESAQLPSTEGFAYFRWHTLRWPQAEKHLSRESCPGCWKYWRSLQRSP